MTDPSRPPKATILGQHPSMSSTAGIATIVSKNILTFKDMQLHACVGICIHPNYYHIRHMSKPERSLK